MKKEILVEIGLTDEQIAKVMAENGKDIAREQGKFADYDDLKSQLKKANDTLSSFGEYKSLDDINKKIDEYKTAADKAAEESKLKIAKMERQATIKEFTGSKKFVNKPTQDYINGLLDVEMVKEENSKKSLDDLFNLVTKDMDNILIKEDAPKAPKVTEMMDTKPDTSAEDNKVRSIMGLSLKK